MKELADKDRIKEWAAASYRRPTKQKTAIDRFTDYLKWAGLTTKELIQEQRDNPDERVAQRRILAFYNHLQDELNKSDISAFDSTKYIRSFYKFYGILLTFRPNELEQPAPKGKDFPLELHHIQGMVHAANLRGKALFLTMESTGLRIGDIVQFKRSEIEPFLDEEKAPVGLEIFTEKERVSAYTFLHRSAIIALKKYLASRADDCPWLFCTRDGNHIDIAEVDRIVKTAFAKAGFKSGNLRIRSHCIRKFTIGRLQDAGVETNLWKRMVGKTVPEAAYSSEKLRESYMKALPRLDPAALVNNHARVQDLEAQVEKLTKAYEALEKRKGIEAMMELYKRIQSGVVEQMLDKPVPSSSINGEQVNPNSLKIDVGEIVVLKSWARTLLQMYSDLEGTDVELLPAGKAWLKKILRTLEK